MATIETLNVRIVRDPSDPFQMKCICAKRPHTFRIEHRGDDPRNERMCSVCAAQLTALGYTTTLVG